MLSILSFVATLSVIFILVCFIYGMALIVRKYVKHISVELIVVVFSIIIFIFLEVLVAPYKFSIFDTSHLISSNILSVFFFGVFLDVIVKNYGYLGVEGNTNTVYYVLSRAVPEFLISQNMIWYIIDFMNYSYSIGILMNVLLWCMIMILSDINYKRSSKVILYHCLDVILQLSAGGYLYLVSGNILLPIIMVICSTLIVESRKKVV